MERIWPTIRRAYLVIDDFLQRYGAPLLLAAVVAFFVCAAFAAHTIDGWTALIDSAPTPR